MAPAFDLNGAWRANDGGVYYIRQNGDLVTWAGLHASGFHMGMEFANVFRGNVRVQLQLRHLLAADDPERQR